MRPRAALNPELPLVARRTFDGYKPGDVFDASRVNIRRLGQLYRSGYIAHVTADAVTADAVTADAVDDSGIEYVNTGAGWYNVELGGVALNTAKLKGLEAAKLWAKEQGYVS